MQSNSLIYLSLIQDGYWAGYDRGKEEGIEPHLDVHPCPVPYCQCQRQNDGTCSSLFYYNSPEFYDNIDLDTNSSHMPTDINGNKQCHSTRNGNCNGACANYKYVVATMHAWVVL